MAQASRPFAEARPFARMGDEEIVARARHGCWRAVDHLLRKYRGLVEGKASAYFVAGADHDDVVQEGMIGLFKAIRDFSAERLCAFRSFADLCITRQIITAVKGATRQKHTVLNGCVSMDVPVDGSDGEWTLADAIAAVGQRGPEETALGHQTRRELRRRIGSELSDLEAQSLLRHVEGESYHDIAHDLGLGVKQIDNALQRAKKKLHQSAHEVIYA